MPSFITGSIFFCSGVLAYLLVAMLAGFGGIETRRKVGTFYYKQSARTRHQFTYLRRVLSGYDVLPISVDAEQKLLKLRLNRNLTKDNNEYPFNDPDNRIKRLFNKPVALAFELVPAAIDAELAEVGHWVREKRNAGGFWTGEWDNSAHWDGGEWTGEVDPYVELADHLRLIDPVDAFEIVPNDVDPENIKTAERLTKERFSKYGPRVSLEGTISLVLAYLVGLGSIGAVAYVQENLLDGGGGGLEGPTFNVFTTVFDPAWMDVVVVLV